MKPPGQSGRTAPRAKPSKTAELAVFQALVGEGSAFGLEDFSRRAVFVGFSGGLDSSVLAHALLKTASRVGSLTAIHVNHRLQPAAFSFERHCRFMASQWNLKLIVKRPAHAKGQQDELGLEASARLRRYKAFEEAMDLQRSPDSDTSTWPVLVLAHHANDQVETALLQWVRGAGLEGLCAMPVLSQRKGYFLWRPLLSLTRKTLEDYASGCHLGFIEDPSNALMDQDRNRIRQQVLPALQAMRPGAVPAMVRSLQHLQQARNLLGQMDRDDLAACVESKGLNRDALLARPIEQQLRTLRAWLVSQPEISGTAMPPARRLNEFLRQLRTARAGRLPVLAVTPPSTGGLPAFRVRLRAGFLTVEWV